jgi:hypothetical protein
MVNGLEHRWWPYIIGTKRRKRVATYTSRPRRPGVRGLASVGHRTSNGETRDLGYSLVPFGLPRPSSLHRA